MGSPRSANRPGRLGADDASQVSMTTRPRGAPANLHEQELNLAMLLRLYGRLANRTVMEVGAEGGTAVEAFLDVGCPRVYAVEFHPPRVRHLQERFGSDDRVRLLDVALGPRDGSQRVPVACRSLSSLVEDGTLPGEIGILKVATEGHDLEVVRGMGRLSAAVVMVGYWDSLPALGLCP